MRGWCLVIFFLGGCRRADQACEVADYAIQVDVGIPADVGRQGVVVHWADEDADDGATGPDGYGAVHLRRMFASREDAIAFDIPFVVRVGGDERGRATPDFATCDGVADTGQDPAERRQGLFYYGLDFDGNLENGGAPAGVECLSDGGIPTVQQALDHTCSISERRLVYRLRIDGPTVPTSLLVDGVDVPPYSISPDASGVFFIVALVSPLDMPATDVEHQLAIEQGGVRSDPFEAAFNPCIGDADGASQHPDDLVYQRQSLEVVDGALVLDDWSGYECLFLDGTGTGASP